MCCQPSNQYGAHRWGHQHGCSCGCLGVEYPRTRFITKKQQIANLEKHLEDLQEEAKAVKAYIAEMKKEK